MNKKTLKQYIEGMIEDETVNMPTVYSSVFPKLLELEAIENYLIAILGIELEITIKPVKTPEGRFYGKGMVEELIKKQPKTKLWIKKKY